MRSAKLARAVVVRANGGAGSSAEAVAARREAVLQHALLVIRALNTENFASFFRLYGCIPSPSMSAYILDFLLLRERIAAFNRIVAAYSPTFPVSRVEEQLRFAGRDEAVTFLEARQAVFANGRADLDTRATRKRTSMARSVAT